MKTKFQKFKIFFAALVAFSFMMAPLTTNFGHGTKTEDVIKLVAITAITTVVVARFAYRTKRGKFVVTSDMKVAECGRFNLNDYLDSLDDNTFDKMNFDKEQIRHLNDMKDNIRKGYAEQNPHMVGEIGANSTISGLISSSIGDLNVKVKRVTANIDLPLPYVLFGLNGLSSSFYSIIKQFLPAGIDFSVAAQANGTLLFTYSQGETSDTVIVSFSGLTNYIQFLNTMGQKNFYTKYILYTINDVLEQDQLDEILNFGSLTSLGAASANQLDLDSRVMTWQYNRDRVDILMPEQKIDANFSFVQNIIPVAGFVVKYNIFMSRTTMA